MAIQTLFGAVPAEPDLLEKLKAGIQKTRSGLVDRLEDVLSGKPEIDAELLEELEYTLITADIGVNTVYRYSGTNPPCEWIARLAGDATEITIMIREHLLEILQAHESRLRMSRAAGSRDGGGREWRR